MRIQDLFEAPLPDDWDRSKFNRTETSFADMVAYARERAKLAGRGSSRVAVTIPYEGRDTVLKVAMNRKGLLQNYEEVSILSDRGYSDILIPMIDYDEENGNDITWIHVEKAQKVTKRELDRALGARLEDVILFIGGNVVPDRYSRARRLPVLPDETFETDLYMSLERFIADYQIKGYMDFARPANWGKYKGEYVLIDVGFYGDAFTAYMGEDLMLEHSEDPLIRKILYHPNTKLAHFFNRLFAGDDRKIVKWLEKIIPTLSEEQLSILQKRPQYIINIYRQR